MRIDGSLKTVTAGVTSLDDKRHAGNLNKQVDNWRCDPMQGLVKRPASTYIAALVDDFTEGTDAIFGVILADILFWIFIQPTKGPNGSHLISVYDELGVEQEVIVHTPSGYFNSLTGNTSIAFSVIGETIYIGNKNEDVEILPYEEAWNTSSMLVIKQAPASFSEIEVTWTDSTETQHTIVHTVPDFITDDVGTNTTAAQIAADMSAEPIPVGDIVLVQGSTILYEREDREFASITATDGANDAVAATLNNETQDINNLPKYAGHNSVVKIRPDKTSDRGQFWMRATAFIETDETTYAQKKIDLALVPEWILTAGAFDGIGNAFRTRGYNRDTAMGTLIPDTLQGENITFLGNFIFGAESEFGIFNFTADLVASPELITYISIVETTGAGELIYESPLSYDEDTPGQSAWIGVSPMGLDAIQDGLTYEIYTERLDDFFGKLPEVVWNEAANPELENYFNPITMPHVLGLDSSGNFITGPQAEIGLRNVHAVRPRRAGDNDTNPFPEFLNNSINDMGRFQDRLVMLSIDTVSISQTDAAHAWFRDTVTQQLAIDPIGIKSTAPNTLTLDYIVTHNNDALLFSKNAQYKLLGSVGITSQNAALPQTTSYDNSGTAKPFSNASDVFFPIAYSPVFAGMSRFSVDKDSDSQDISIAVTHHVQELIPGDIEILTASSTLNMVFAKSNLESHVLYVYEYVDSRQEPQTAWSKWIFHSDVQIDSIFFRENRLQVVARDAADITHLLELRINQAITFFSPRVMYMDFLTSETGITTTFVPPADYPIDEPTIKLYQGTDAPDPGAEIVGWVWTGTQFNLPFTLDNGGIIVGYPFRSSLIPSRRWIRDDSGTPQTASKFRITDYNFWAVGDILNVDILNAPNTWPTQVFTNDDPTQDAVHRVSFKQRHDEADIEIWTEDPFNTEVLQIEWRGTYIKVGRRF